MLHRYVYCSLNITKSNLSLSESLYEEMNNFVDLSSNLSADYEKLYESHKYADVSIQIGREQSSKIFFAHALVLCTRSKFLENRLTGMQSRLTRFKRQPS